MEVMLETAIDSFPWESQTQREGFLHLVQFWRKFGLEVELPLTNMSNLTALFFIQKDHESNEYWTQMVGDQFTGLGNQIHQLQETVKNLEATQEHILSLVKSQAQTIEMLVKAQAK